MGVKIDCDIPGGNIIIAGDCIDGTAPDAEDGTIGPVVEWNYIEQLVGSVEGLVLLVFPGGVRQSGGI